MLNPLSNLGGIFQVKLLFPSKIQWDRIPMDPETVSCDRAVRCSGFFGVRETWVNRGSDFLECWPRRYRVGSSASKLSQKSSDVIQW